MHFLTPVNMKVIVLILATVLSFAFATPWEPEPRPEVWWLQKHEAFVNNSVRNYGTINLLFYGDSITERWTTVGFGRPVFEQYYLPLGTANYGIDGDRTEHVLWRIQNGEVTDLLHPSVCVIRLGTNNLSFDPDPSNDPSVAMGVISNVFELGERLPNMKVLVLGILPRENETMTQRTENVNKILQKLDNGKTIRFLDMKDYFYRGGDNFVTELYIADLLHLSEAGYWKWAEVMDPLLKEMMGSS